MPQTSIAVLPFRNLSQDASNEYLSDGLTEEIIHALTQVEGLKVSSRRSSFFFKGKDSSLDEIADQLKVEVILEGSIRLDNNQMRISTALVELKSDSQFWSETWDRDISNLFQVQDEISLLIADRLREQYGHLEYADHLGQRETANLSAYEHDLKARYHFNKWNAQDVALAIEHWDKALAIDPQQGRVHEGLADAYGFLGTTQEMDFMEAWTKAYEHTHQALAINPKSAGVHYQLANISFFTEFDYQSAFKHILNSIECDPNYPEGLQFLAFLYIVYGRPNMAKPYLDRALDRDPLNQETLFYQAYYHYRKTEYEAAQTLLEALLLKNPENLPAKVTYLYVLLKSGSSQMVLEQLEVYQSSLPEGDYLGLKTLAHLFKGDADWEGHFAELETRAQNPMAYQEHAYYYESLVNQGAFDEAFAWVEKAIEFKSFIMLLAYGDPLAEDLHEDMRYPIYHHRIYGALPKLGPKKQKSDLLDVEAAREYREKLLGLMREEEPFLNPQLSLRTLGSQMELHPNQLSWLLNDGFGKNFNEFVNAYRVQTFKKLALNPENAHISLLGLAFESGFNSKTVFNTSFKKETGMSPKAYLDQQKDS